MHVAFLFSCDDGNQFVVNPSEKNALEFEVKKNHVLRVARFHLRWKDIVGWQGFSPLPTNSTFWGSPLFIDHAEKVVYTTGSSCCDYVLVKREGQKLIPISKSSPLHWNRNTMRRLLAYKPARATAAGNIIFEMTAPGGCVTRALEATFGQAPDLPAAVRKPHLERIGAFYSSNVIVLEDGACLAHYDAGKPTTVVLQSTGGGTHCVSAELAQEATQKQTTTDTLEALSLSPKILDGDEICLRGDDAPPKEKKKRARMPRQASQGYIGTTARRSVGSNLRSVLKRDNLDAELRQAVQKVADATKRTREMQRDNPSYIAGNFGAKNFGAASLSAAQEEMLEEAGVPCVTPQSCLSEISGFIEGHSHLSKYYWGRSQSFVLNTIASSQQALAAMPAGATVYVVVPLQHAFKGAVIAYRTPGTSTWGVLGYVAPDRDPETLGTQTAVLGAKLQIALPTVIGGTVTQVANVMCEMAQVPVNPISLIAGKVAPLAKGRVADVNVLGQKPLEFVAFTGSLPKEQVVRYSSYDQQNSALVALPSGGSSARGSMYPTLADKLQFVCTYGDTTNGPQAGFQANLSSFFNLGTSDTQIWSISQNGDYFRHLLYGDFTADIRFPLRHVNNTAGADSMMMCVAKWVVTFSDGSQVIEQFGLHTSSFDAAAAANASNDHYAQAQYDTRGCAQYAAKRGLIITDISLSMYKSAITGPSNQFGIAGGNQYSTNSLGGLANVTLTMHDVFAHTTYLCAVLAGAVTQATLNVQLHVDTEVHADPSSIVGVFAQPTETLQRPSEPMTMILQNLATIAGQQNAEGMHAASFKDSIKKFGARLFSAGKHIARAQVGPRLDMLDPTGNATRTLFATSFGEGASVSRGTGMWYPAVTLADGVGAFSGEVLEVYRGESNGPAFAPSFRSDNSGVHGRSGELAFALAVLRSAGAPIRRGTYSGQVSDIEIDEDNRVAYLLIDPVDCRREKTELVPKLTALFPDGVFCNGHMHSIFPKTAFGNSVELGCEMVDAPKGFPDGSRSARVKLSW
jgi:hypothetical protein